MSPWICGYTELPAPEHNQSQDLGHPEQPGSTFDPLESRGSAANRSYVELPLRATTLLSELPKCTSAHQEFSHLEVPEDSR